MAAGAGGFVGVSGAVGVTLINTKTLAKVSQGALINTLHQDVAGGNQSVYVDAGDNATVQTFVIGIAGGFVGVSGAVDVGTLNDDTDAEVDENAEVRAKKDVSVNAVALKSITSFDASGAGGFVGVGGAVSDWSIGTPIQKTYSNDGDGSSGSTPQSANALEAASHGFQQSDVDTGANTIELHATSETKSGTTDDSTQGFTTGTEVVYHDGGGADITTTNGSLVDGGHYFVGQVLDSNGNPTDKIKLYNSAQDAQNDTNAIDFTGTGNDNQSLSGLDSSCRRRRGRPGPERHEPRDRLERRSGSMISVATVAAIPTRIRIASMRGPRRLQGSSTKTRRLRQASKRPRRGPPLLRAHRRSSKQVRPSPRAVQ